MRERERDRGREGERERERDRGREGEREGEREREMGREREGERERERGREREGEKESEMSEKDKPKKDEKKKEKVKKNFSPIQKTLVSENRAASATLAASFPRTLKLLVRLNSKKLTKWKLAAMSACDIPIRCSVIGAHCLFSSSGRTTRSQSGTSTRIVAVANTDTDAGGMSKLPNLRCRAASPPRPG